MKLNINVDLQEIFDNTNEGAFYAGESGEHDTQSYDLNDHIMQAVINGILEKVSAKCLDRVMAEADKRVNAALTEAIEKSTQAIEQKAVDYASDWLNNKEVTITDKWGKETFSGNIEALVQKSFDQTLEKRVDANGEFSTNSYNNPKMLIEYVTGSEVEKLVTARLPNFTKKIDLAVRAAVDQEMEKSLAAKIKTLIDKAS